MSPGPASGKPASGVPARGYSRPPFEEGNTAALKHGFYSRMRPEDQAEVEELEAAYRAALGERHDPALDPLVSLAAALSWRIRRGNADLSDRGVVRDGAAAGILPHLASTERSLLATLDALALTVGSAAEAGLALARADALRLDRLDPGEQLELRRLLEKAQEPEDGL